MTCIRNIDDYKFYKINNRPAYEATLKEYRKEYTVFVYPEVNHWFHNDSHPDMMNLLQNLFLELFCGIWCKAKIVLIYISFIKLY